MINVYVTAVSWGNKVVKHSWIPLNSSTFSKVLLCAVATFLTVFLSLSPNSFLLSRWVFLKFCKYYEIVMRNLIISHPVWRRRQWHPTPVLLPGKSHGRRSLVGCSPWGSLRVRHNWATSLALFTFMHWRRKWQPTPVFLPGESQGRRGLVAQSQTRLKWLSSSSIYSEHLGQYLAWQAPSEWMCSITIHSLNVDKTITNVNYSMVLLYSKITLQY